MSLGAVCGNARLARSGTEWFVGRPIDRKGTFLDPSG